MAEPRKTEAIIESAIVSLILRDKGTRLGCELWRASGLIVKTKHFDQPVVLTTASTLPDSYHSVHATVYFNPPDEHSEALSTTLAPAKFFVSSAMNNVVENFTNIERKNTIQALYTFCSLSTELPPHVEAFDIDTFVPVVAGAHVLAWGSKPMSGVVRAVHQGEIEFSPDPTVDESLPNGAPVFMNINGDISLIGLHLGHTYDSDREKAEDGGLELNFLSRGEWRHRICHMETILQHLDYSMKAIKAMKGEEREKMETFLGKGNFRRDRINASLEVLDEIIAHPSKPPPEIFSTEDAELLATQAQGKGFEVVLTLMRVYRDDDVQLHSLEALFKLLTQGRQACAQAVAKAGGCELVALALQRNLHNTNLVAGASKCISLLAERRDVNLRFLRCDVSTPLITGLRLASQHGSHHLEAQRWGLSAVAVLARNGLHKERMFAVGLCEIIPDLLANHPEVINDLDLQISGLSCILELSSESMDTAGSSILDAGLMASLRKVRSGKVGKTTEWKELATVVLSKLDWEG